MKSYFGLRSYFPSIGGSRRARRPHAVVNVRQGGQRTYMLRTFNVVFDDEFRLERLMAAVRADMSQRDARIGNAMLTLVDGVTGAPIASTVGLDRALGAGSRVTLAYKVDASRMAPATTVPPIARRIGAPIAAPVTVESRLDKLRTTVVAQLGAALGAAGTLPTLVAARAEARRVLRDNQRLLTDAGIKNPVHQTNLIAADLAAAVRGVNPAVLTSANAPRVFSLAAEKSPVWKVIECKMAPACKGKAPAAATYEDDNDEDEEETPAALMARIGASVSGTQLRLPVTYISSAVPTLTASAADNVLARLGIRMHTAADYTAELVPTVEPLGAEACNDCQTIGHRYRCGRRCRRHLRRLEEKRLFDAAHGVPATPATPATPARPLGANITFEPIGDAFAPVAGAPELEFRPLQPVGATLEFRPTAAASTPQSIEAAITLAPLAPEPVGAELEFRPLQPAGAKLEFRPLQTKPVGDELEFRPLTAAAIVDLKTVQPTQVAASAPAGFRVLLRSPADNSETLVTAAPTTIRPGPRHIVVENAAGKQRTVTAEPIHFHAGQTSTISVDASSWRCSTVDNVGSAIAAAYASQLAAHTTGLVLLHTDGTATTAPIGAWAASTNEEHEAAAASGRSYFFDSTRSLVADANNRMHPVLAVAKHPAAPEATVVLLPPIALPVSN